jgi:hypothetical protein
MLKPGIYKVKQNATNGQLQAAIESVIPMATKQMAGQAKQYKGKNDLETCRNIFIFLKGLNYKADGNEQQVRLPSALARTRTGDCKSYSVYTSAVLSNLNIPHYLTYTSYNPSDKTPTHVYVTTKNGCIIDAVYGIFNKEKKPSFKINKPMNISYIAGIKTSNSRINNVNAGTCGIMGAETGKDWAQKLGIWDSLPITTKSLYLRNTVTPLYGVARGIFLSIIRKNGGGLANSLYKIYQVARANNASPEFKKYRAIELEFLQKGGNPNELRQAFEEGNTKTPTGAYFNQLMKDKAAGKDVKLTQWIKGAISLLFGKKYNESTGEITGAGLGIGDPATAAAGTGSAAIWASMIGTVVTTLGTALIAAKVNPASGEAPTGPITPDTGAGAGEGARRNLTPILLIGGAAAALYFITKKK